MTLRRGRETADYTIREVTPEEAGPVLKRYVSMSRPTRPYFYASKDAPVDEFVAEADRHPVFELIPPSKASHRQPPDTSPQQVCFDRSGAIVGRPHSISIRTTWLTPMIELIAESGAHSGSPTSRAGR